MDGAKYAMLPRARAANDGMAKNDGMASVGAAVAPPPSRHVRCRCGPTEDTVAVVFSSVTMALTSHVYMTGARDLPRVERLPSAAR